MNQFYALLKNGDIRNIDLADDIVDSTKELFVNASSELMKDDTDIIEFNGTYVIKEDDNEISYIDLELPKSFEAIPDNQASITPLDVENDVIKSLVWYNDGALLFQLFSSGNLLESKYVLRFFQEEHTFNRLTEKAFIIGNKIQAIYKKGRLYFKSFPSASKIFDLSSHMVEATAIEVREFGMKENVIVNVDWLSAKANNKTRRLIKMISSSGTLDTFMSLKDWQRNKISKSVNIDVPIRDGKLELPTDVSKVNKILEFLNEDVYPGIITGKVFRTNSKRPSIEEKV